MAAKIIDGKAIAEELRAELAAELDALKKAGAHPGIATLMVGDDFGAGMYRGAVEKFCGEMGLGYRNEILPADTWSFSAYPRGSANRGRLARSRSESAPDASACVFGFAGATSGATIRIGRRKSFNGDSCDARLSR